MSYLTHQIYPNQWESKIERIKNFFKDESGASAVEYGLLVPLIAVVIIAGVTLLGTSINTIFTNAGNSIAS